MDGRYLIWSVYSVWLSGAVLGDMSQVRVTDFFSQRKKGLAGPVKAARQRDRGSSGTDSYASTRAGCAKNKELCSSSVHQEFVRVIDEAAGLHNEDSFGTDTAKNLPSSPRTPKRSSADAGAVAFSTTADHSTAKKRRQAQEVREPEAAAPERTTRRTARKKLVLPQDAPQVRLCCCTQEECVLGFVSGYQFITSPPCVCVSWGRGVFTPRSQLHVSLLMWRIELLPDRVHMFPAMDRVCVE